MSIDIAPGTKVNIKVVHRPTSDAAEKTIIRLLRKDAKVKAEDARLQKTRVRHFRSKMRGGRVWNIRVPARKPTTAGPGASGTVLATLDVLRDLRSVSRFVEVTPA